MSEDKSCNCGESCNCSAKTEGTSCNCLFILDGGVAIPHHKALESKHDKKILGNHRPGCRINDCAHGLHYGEQRRFRPRWNDARIF